VVEAERVATPWAALVVSPVRVPLAQRAMARVALARVALALARAVALA
jgi:hypothetical protein